MGNPVIPNAPEGFGDFDFAQAETRARQLYYASGEWADERERDSDGQEILVEDTEVVQTEDPVAWYRTQDRPLPPNLAQFVLNWLVMNADMEDWDAGIIQALEILIAKGTKKMSQTALAELAVRQGEMHIRTGEAESAISWAEITDMGDASAQQLTIGGLEFTVLEYGGRLHIPMKLRMLLNEGDALGGNQCSIIHLTDGIEWHLQKRPNRFPSKTRVISLAAELRIHGLNREGEMWKHYSRFADTVPKSEDIAKAICHDVTTANHDRDFRAWPLFSGGKWEIIIRAFELWN